MAIGKINIKKNMTISLDKLSNESKQFKFSANWSKSLVKKVDLDISAIMFDSTGTPEDIVFYGKKMSQCKGVKLLGDNRTGNANGEDSAEEIIFNVDSISNDISVILLYLSIYTDKSNDTISMAKDLSLRITDTQHNEIVTDYVPSIEESNTQCILFGKFELINSTDGSGSRTATYTQLYDDNKSFKEMLISHNIEF